MSTDFDYQHIEGEANELLQQHFTSDFRHGYVKVRGAVLPVRYKMFAETIENMTIYDDDIWVMSYPKTGTTWTQEMVWCIANDLDFEGAKEMLPKRFPFFEHSALFDYGTALESRTDISMPKFANESIDYSIELARPRFIKTHLPWQVLPREIRDGVQKPKIIYVCRNPKDTCVSYFHHAKLMEGYKGDFETFYKLFLKDSLLYSPFWSHIFEFYNRRNVDNVLFLKYEDMKKDLPSVVRQTAEFLGKQLAEDQVSKLCEHLSFQSMKNNPAVNYEAVVEFNKQIQIIDSPGQFLRSGTVGDWKGSMTPEIIEMFDKWTEEHLKDSDFTF